MTPKPDLSVLRAAVKADNPPPEHPAIDALFDGVDFVLTALARIATAQERIAAAQERVVR